MKLANLSLSSFLWTFLSPLDVQGQAPIIDVGSAQYKGVTNLETNVSSYLGIRYAAAPVGDLRWRAPRPPPALSGVQSAVAQPVQCLQAPPGISATNPLPRQGLVGRQVQPEALQGSEDCLFLNVYFPGSSVPKHKLPVIVWIHGGGYILGNASMYDAENLVRSSANGIVAVVIQYRLGVFGFLPGNEVKANGSLNAGLLDQEFALKWVQKYISKFGGDPKQVTIWGESAGAGSVLQHVIARDGKTSPPLFRAAMAGSVFLPSQYAFNDTIPEFVYNRLVFQAGCGNSSNTLACLRATDISLIQAANININQAGFFGTFVTVPVVDGEYITQRPIQALQQRKVNGGALLVTSNTHEGNFFVNQSSSIGAAQYASELFPRFGPRQSEAVARLYEGLGSPVEQANLIQGEAIFICPTYFLLRAFPNRSFKGEFAVPPGFHGDDISYYFPSFAPPTFNNTLFITSFSQSFIGFARALDPNFKFNTSNITPHWGRYTDSSNIEMLFNRTEDGRPDIRAITTDKALLERCAFWESVGELTGQ